MALFAELVILKQVAIADFTDPAKTCVSASCMILCVYSTRAL